MNAAWSASLDADAGKANLLYDAQHVTSLELSPNGQSLVVAAVPTALVDDGLMKTRLHVLNATSGDLMARVDTPGKLGGYVISPDNQRIAFQAGTDIHDTSTGVLMVANLSDGRFEQLTAEAPQHIVDLAWLDDDSILTVAHRGVESAVVAYNLTGNEERLYSTPDDIVVRDLEIGQ